MRLSHPEYAIDIVDAAADAFPTNAIRIIYVVEGTCVVISEGKTVLGKTDLLLVNVGDSLKIKPSKDGLVAVISIEYYLICDFLGRTDVRFFANSREAVGTKYVELKERLQHLLLAYASNGMADPIAERGYYYLVLDSLVSKFLAQGGGGETPVDPYALRMLHYVHANYRVNVSLNEIAEELSISQSWASRVFRTATGEHFPRYVRRLRTGAAERLLAETDRSITSIAMDNGFSTPSAFTKAFKGDFGMTPSEYRERHRVFSETDQDDDRRKNLLYQVLDEDRRLAIADLESQKIIHADASQRTPWRGWRNRILNVGPAYVLTSAKLQRHVLFLAEKLNVEYVRLWSVFSSQLMMRREGQTDYNFSFIDEILDFCVDHKLKVFFDFATRKAVAIASETENIFSYEDEAVFATPELWADMLRKFLEHIRKRYGEKTVEQWIYEFTFSLNDKPYYLSDDYRVQTVWERGYEIVKSVLPAANVAGPGLIGTPDQESMRTSIEGLLSAKTWPDIFTSMHFPYRSDRSDTGSIYQQTYKKVANRDFMYNQALYIKNTLDKHHFTGEFWITDWGCSLANRNFLQDSCFRAAFIAENGLKAGELADTLGIFYASDIINAYSDAKAELSGSAGLLTRNGICKPAYYAFHFLDELGNNLLSADDSAVITCDDPDDIRILCFNDKTLGPKYYLSTENSYRPRDLENLFVNTERANLSFVIHLADESVYGVRQMTLNNEKGSVLDNWIAFDCPDELSRDDLDYLSRTAVPEITSQRMHPVDGLLRITVKLKPNEIRFITITRE